MTNTETKPLDTKRLTKTPQGLAVLRKMLQGGSVEEIKARMTAEDLQTIKAMVNRKKEQTKA